MKNWLTAKDVAEKSMVSTATVRRWIEDGKLAAVRLPSRHYRVKIADYRDFLIRYNMPVPEDIRESES